MLNTLVVAEVALSLVLLAGAGLLMRSFVKLQSVDPGFRADGVLTASVQLPPARYDLTQAGSFFRESLAGIAGLPGVQHAAGASCLPVPFAVHRHQLLARRSSEAGVRPAVLQPGATRYPGILQDDGHSAGGRT